MRCTRQLEQRLARFLGTEDVILYSSCFDANGGLFETLLDERDAVISDALNHASIIDGIRLCKAQRLRYANSNMAELEQCLKDSQGARTRLIATDGVFSMDGFIAKLPEICDLAERYDAQVMVDDSHATGFMGAGGRGTPEHCGVADAHRHPHRHPRQGAGRWQRRLHRRQARGGRVAAAALAPVPVLQQHPPGGGRRQHRGAGPAGEHPGAAHAAVRERALLPRRAHARRL